MGRVPLIRKVVHPEMLWMRAVFGGVGGWLSGARVVGSLFGAAVFFPHQGQMVLLSGSGVPHSVQKCIVRDH